MKSTHRTRIEETQTLSDVICFFEHLDLTETLRKKCWRCIVNVVYYVVRSVRYQLHQWRLLGQVTHSVSIDLLDEVSKRSPIQNYQYSDFSISVPIPGNLNKLGNTYFIYHHNGKVHLALSLISGDPCIYLTPLICNLRPNGLYLLGLFSGVDVVYLAV